MSEFRIMAIDDEEIILDSIKDYFDELDIKTFNNPARAIKELEKNYYDIIIADYKMPGLNGLELLIEAKKSSSYNFGILLTAFAEKDLLEQFINKNLIKKVIEKPLKLNMLKETLDNALIECRRDKEMQEEALKINILYKESQEVLNLALKNIVGITGGLKDLFKKIQKVAKTSENILVTGETGTGKGVIANAVHSLSRRSEKPFIKINCGAVPENLIESELFGHLKGAFTGAVSDKIGKIELANNGTLFLDEIGELKPDVQSKLLNVIQEKKIERLGSNKIIDVNFRLICATNQDIDKAINEKRFRDDLYYRISTIHLEMPPLRDRADDIEPLVINLLKNYCAEIGIKEMKINQNALDSLKKYSWPGNIRELENVIKRAILLNTDDSYIEAWEFNYLFSKGQYSLENDFESALKIITDDIVNNKKNLNTIKEDIINKLLKKFDGNVTMAVKESGILKDMFYRLKKDSR